MTIRRVALIRFRMGWHILWQTFPLQPWFATATLVVFLLRFGVWWCNIDNGPKIGLNASESSKKVGTR